MKKNSKKIFFSSFISLLILACCFSSIVPLNVVAYNPQIIVNNIVKTDTQNVQTYYGANSVSLEEEYASRFTPTQTGRLFAVTNHMITNHDDTNCKVHMRILAEYNSTSPDRSQVLEVSSSVFNVLDWEAWTDTAYSFSFSGNLVLEQGTYYWFSIYCTDPVVLDSAHNIAVYKGVADWTSSVFYDGYWHGVTGDMTQTTIGDLDPAPTATPTPTASPIPTTDPSGGIWSTLTPYGNILLPLVLILVVAIICGRFGGVWGFFAGLNVTVILIYAVMGSTYFPLWGMILLGTVDALLLFGKATGRV